MGRQDHQSFGVGGSTYHVEKMNADVAYRFGLKVMSALTGILPVLRGAPNGAAGVLEAIQGASIDPDKWAAISEEAREHLILPNNQPAANPVHFQAWFDGHPEDLFPASVMAIWHLVSDFLPSSLRTQAAAIGLSAGTASASPSPKDGK